MTEVTQLSRLAVRRKLAAAERCGVLALGGVGVAVAGYYVLLFSVMGLRSLYELSFGFGDLVFYLLFTLPMLVARSATRWFQIRIADYNRLACPHCDRLLENRSDWLVIVQTRICPQCRNVVVADGPDEDTPRVRGAKMIRKEQS